MQIHRPSTAMKQDIIVPEPLPEDLFRLFDATMTKATLCWEEGHMKRPLSGLQYCLGYQVCTEMGWLVRHMVHLRPSFQCNLH